ncbi:uncharacterized protein EV422DRAFT_575535 [Fimicolochytrium jonesii]|uniref:uncharacterized protein n=1 Tax=Fimicolochytrium jonesii TaxID=1396493 RepID=UPI0022FE72B0|nr:uncharacterized protein EV422DRAFT_575535 [Fimicolochytrium jonesii]KAI8825586.1 hypothetical protein EV422DRAFT_575535 [Fimicolochytrium jonesii]
MLVGFTSVKQALASLLLTLLVTLSLLNNFVSAAEPVEDLEVPVGNPNLAGFRYNKTVFGGAPGKNRYDVYWNVDNVGTPQEQLHVVLRLTGPALKWAWVGIGFGRTMLEGQFVVCHQIMAKEAPSAPTNTELHEHWTRKQYAPPRDRDQTEAAYTQQAAIPVVGFTDSNTLTCEFTRATKPADRYHVPIDVTTDTNLLWAFNPASEKNSDGGWFTYHGDIWRGALVAGLAEGDMLAVATKSFQKKQAHGFGMIAVWLLIFPFGAYYARYLRSTAGWNIVHLVIQSTGVCAIIILIVIIVTDMVFLNRAHAYLGITMLVLILFQFFLGITNLLGLSYERAARLKKVVRRVHQFLGLSVILAATVQAGLGINKLYPWQEDRGKAVWGVYIGLILFWTILFISTETYFRRSVRRTDPKKAGGAYSDLRKIDATNTMVPMKQKVKRGETAVTLINASNSAASTTIPMTQTRLRPGLTQYTWGSLNQAIMNGELLVVANGRYVYSIAQWINSHPGGQLILHAVNGTDITNDYFHEAGFDADEFTPRPEAPAQRNNRANAEASLGRRNGDLASLTSTEMNKSLNSFGDELVEEMRVAPTMNEKDWKLVVKSRRTNVHSRLAIERLSKLLVGELVPENTSSSSEMGNANAPFDPNEYRRYAMVENTPIAERSSVVKFRFCLLYPYDVRSGEPQVIFPGQAIEICARIKNKLVTRYYSPLGTTGLSTIEIMAKIYPDGVMSQYLFKQKPGDRQIKIRGPFGTPLFHPEKTLVPSDRVTWFPTNLLYIAGGTGITPFLQLLTAAIFPVAEPLRVHTEYLPQIDDELTLQRNDHVAVSHHYYDGWAVGVNLRTGQHGAFPLTVTVPYPGMNLLQGGKLTLIHAVRTAGEAILGDELLEGAMLAYPGVLEIHRFIADGSTPEKPLGVLYASQLSEPNLEDILKKRWRDTDAHGREVEDEDEEKAALRQIVVCGPTGFGSWVVDALSEGSVDMRRVVILPSDRVL